MSETENQPPKYDQRQAKIFGNAPEAKDSIIVSGEIVKGNQIIGKQYNYYQQQRDPSKPPSNLNKQGSSHFVGRNDKLGELHDLLQQENKAAICAVSGMGGIGKTELAVQYANQYQEEYTGGLCWLQVRGADVGTQIVDYSRALLGLNPPDELEIKQKVQYCWRNWIEGKTLIVYDDIDSYEAINDYLPPTQSQFKVVMTSRIEPGANVIILDLDVLSENDSLTLLRSILGKEAQRIDEDLEGAKSLCEWLGYLPLGLELVGRYLKEHSSLKLDKLQKRLEKKKLEAPALLKEGQSDMTGQLGVASAFDLTWEDLDPEIKSLGCFLSLFAPVSFEWSWVQQCYFDTDETTIEAWNELREDEDEYQNYLEEISEQLKKDGQTVDEFDQNVEEWLEQSEEQIEQLETERDSHLIKLHLLEKVGETQYKLHSLIREFFQVKSQTMEGMDDARRKFCAVMVEKGKISQSPTLSEILAVSSVMPHVAEIAKNLNEWVSEEDALWPFVGLSRFYEGQSAYSQAETWAKLGLKMMRRRFGQEHPYVADSLNNLAYLYQSMGRYEQAEPYYQQALDMRRRLLGDEHPYVADSLNNLAGLYQSMGGYEQAEPYYQQALNMRQRLLGDEHPYVADSLNNRAGLYYAMGEYEQAEPYYQQALNMRQRLLGDEHPDVAQSLNNLAGLYCAMGRYEQAEPYYEQALDMSKRLLGDEQPDVATSLNNLAELYRAMGRYEQAEPYYEQALDMSKRLLGDEHPSVATSLNNLAGLYESMGRYEQAISYYLAAIELAQRVLGEDHPNTQTMQNNYLLMLLQAPSEEILRFFPEEVQANLLEMRRQYQDSQ